MYTKEIQSLATPLLAIQEMPTSHCPQLGHKCTFILDPTAPQKLERLRLTLPKVVMKYNLARNVGHDINLKLDFDAFDLINTFIFKVPDEGDPCTGTPFRIDLSSTGSANEGGEITSPDFPAQYPNAADCKWELVVDEGRGVVLNFTLFDVEDG